MIIRILDNTTIIAIIIKAEYKKEGFEFFTPDSFSQQLAYMNRSKGYKVGPHTHNRVDKMVNLTQEVLYIKSGKIKVLLYDNENVFLEEQILSKGDVILLASGGHAIEMLEDSEIIEVKQGPYSGDQDKANFTPSPAYDTKATT